MKQGTKQVRFADKYPRLLIRQEHPLNMEPPPPLLRQSFLTAHEVFFVRNHGNIPEVNPSQYSLRVDGLVAGQQSLSLETLRHSFPKRAVTAVIQCAGNRRDELIALRPISGEVPWNAAAIGNAQWAGVSLRDVLQSTGIGERASHVAFTGLDDVVLDGSQFPFGGSIPLERALSDDVLLAYEMNGRPLSPAHGFPLRVVVPGYVGARSVKWLAAITVQAEPSSNYFQARAYKLFPPDAPPQFVDWTTGATLYETPVNSVICAPSPTEPISPGTVSIKGYATGGGGCRISRVELSVDAGNTWVQADVFQKDGVGAWCFWEIEIDLAADLHEIVVRATDSQGNTQPDDARRIWNFKGYVNNSWHRVKLQVVSGPGHRGSS